MLALKVLKFKICLRTIFYSALVLSPRAVLLDTFSSRVLLRGVARWAPLLLDACRGDSQISGVLECDDQCYASETIARLRCSF